MHAVTLVKKTVLMTTGFQTSLAHTLIHRHLSELWESGKQKNGQRREKKIVAIPIFIFLVPCCPIGQISFPRLPLKE